MSVDIRTELTPDMLEDAERKMAADMVCRHLGNTLKQHYPTRNWVVDVRMSQGVAGIFCPDVSLKYGIIIHLTHIIFDLERRAVMAGGEILERFGLSREQGASNDDVLDLDRHINGEAVLAETGGEE